MVTALVEDFFNSRSGDCAVSFRKLYIHFLTYMNLSILADEPVLPLDINIYMDDMILKLNSLPPKISILTSLVECLNRL